MDILLQDFQNDLARLKKLQALISLLDGFRAHQKPAIADNPFFNHALSLCDAVIASHADLLVLSGAMVLYLAGRFEFYVRERFEHTCEAIGVKSASLDHLPKPMKENLIQMTAEVMMNPRKYGHAEKGVDAFVKRLAANMTATEGIKDINRECLSVTTENMRSSVLKDLFERVGCKDIWQTISEQACIRTHFGTVQVTEAKSKCTKYLNEFMDVRNKIAHPSNNFEWPALPKVSEYISYFEILGKAVSDVIELHETSIPNTIPDVAAVNIAAAPPADSSQQTTLPAQAEPSFIASSPMATAGSVDQQPPAPHTENAKSPNSRNGEQTVHSDEK